MDPDPGKTIILFSLSLERASCFARTIPELDGNLRVGFEKYSEVFGNCNRLTLS